jgi:hypothetical protein
MAISWGAELNGYQPDNILRQLAKGNYSSIFLPGNHPAVIIRQ